MGKKSRNLVLSGTILVGAWNAYSAFTTVKDLPEDAGGLVKMLTDPPVYLPWAIFAGFVILFAWSFWPSKDKPSDNSDSNTTTGHQSPNIIGSNNTVNIHGFPPLSTSEVSKDFDQDAWIKGWDNMGRVMDEMIQQEHSKRKP